MSDKKISFEEAYEKLEAAAQSIMDEEISLEKAVESYREGRKYYEICSAILADAKQLVQVYDKETGVVKEFAQDE